MIDEALDQYLPSEGERPKTIHKAMRYSVFSGGKRIRPILAIESCKVCGGKIEDIKPIAAAIELIHTYSLIHDDLPAMDDDDYRRGRPTSHKAFGEANAILAGDALLTLGFNIISKKADSKIGLKVIGELSESIGTRGMIGGQVVDLEFSAKTCGKNRSVDVDTLDYINRLKTGRLFEASTRIGAIVGGSSARELENLAHFGALIGMAFQIIDDIIDEEGYAKIFGLDKSRWESKNLIEKAKRALSIFGKKADRLKDMADRILTRTK